MEKDGLIERKIYNESPVRVEYQITEKGIALAPILDQMAAFSMKFCAREIFKDRKARTFREIFGFNPRQQ